MSLARSFVLCIVLIGAATACHRKAPTLPAQVPIAATPPAVRPAVPPPAPPPPPLQAARSPMPTETPLSDDEMFRRKSLDQLNAEQPLSDVFFDLDQSVLTSMDRENLDRDAHWLLRWKQTAIEIDGYADERGTAEYNLALGDRRARAARSYLVDLGVPVSRIRTVSYGKERGFCHESNEACWSQNRRGHFVITAK